MGFISSENHMWSSKTAYIPCLLLFYEEDIEVSFFFSNHQSDVMQFLKTLYEQ